jgi:hypothetical protein
VEGWHLQLIDVLSSIQGVLCMQVKNCCLFSQRNQVVAKRFVAAVEHLASVAQKLNFVLASTQTHVSLESLDLVELKGLAQPSSF